jgi:cytochrome c oxidase assembly protein subunit 15
MVALALAVLLALAARDWREGVVRRWDLRRGPLAIAVAGAAGVVLVTGVVVTAAGPHSGDDDVIRRWGDLVLAAEVHVRAAIAFTALAVVLVAWVARERGVDRVTGRLFLAALPLVALQIGLGEYQYRNGLPWQVVVFHVTVAALVWAVIVGAVAGVVRPLRAPVYRRREATRWQGTQRTESGSALSRPSGISEPQSTQMP